MSAWSQPTTAAIAYARAGGRRRVNAERKMAAMLRKRQVWHWYQRWAEVPNVRALLAHCFGLNRSTITRYLQELPHQPIDLTDDLPATEKTAHGQPWVQRKMP